MLVRLLGAILALGGIVTIIMAVTVTTGSSWLTDLIAAEDGDDGMSDAQRDFAADAASAGLLFEAFIYIFGVYMLVMGALAVQGCGKKCAGNKMCVCLFQIFQLALFLLTLIMTLIPAGMYMISDEDVAEFCAATPQQIADENTEDSWKAEMLAEGRQYVADVDASVNARSDLMCRDPCGCQVADFAAWNDGTADWTAPREWIAGGDVSNWSDCNTAIQAYNSSNSRN